MKSTQLAYPTPAAVQHLDEQRNANPLLKAVSSLKLVKGDVQNDKLIHYLRDGAVVLYKRTESGVWQVRFKLWDRQWHRFTTKYKELAFALRAAGDLYDRARFKEEMGTHYGLAMQNLMREQRVTHQPLDDFDQDMLL